MGFGGSTPPFDLLHFLAKEQSKSPSSRRNP
jgi:hypothetical protein